MKIYLNQTIFEIEPMSLAQLLAQQQIQLTGLAVAINQRIVPQSQWTTTILHEYDQVILFQAIAGG